jgi:hypothetical protein
MKLNYSISPADLKLNDQDLYLKIFVYELETNNLSPNILQDEIVRLINISRERLLCSCGGTGNLLLSGFKKCPECNGKGYIGQ